MANQAKGTFKVKITPAEPSLLAQEVQLGRMTIDKTFFGALEASSKGEMLTGVTESTGSMAYVALERVTGQLDGRTGTFVLMHNGTMLQSNPAAGELRVVVVPASGTGELSGLAGTMSINIDKTGQHSYEIKYTLPSPA